jgi:streptogrisin C
MRHTKRIMVVEGCTVLASVLGALLASASYADVPNLDGFGPLAPTPFSSSVRVQQPVSTGQLRDHEIAVYVSKNIPRARAAAAVALQHKVMQAEIIGKMEAAMGSAYGGAWFEPAAARFHIGVTSPASRRAAEGVILREGLASEVTLTPVRSSWAELEAAQKQWNSHLPDLLARAEAQTGLSAQHNAVEVTLSSSVPTTRRGALEREASIATVNVRVTVARSPQVGGSPAGEKTECAKFKTFAAYCNKPITSGVTIEREAEPKFCTAGPLAIPEANVNETYLLTAGHCGSVGQSFYSYYKNGELHEIGKASTMVWNRGGDYGVIPVEAAAWKEAGNEPVFAVTAQWKFNEERSYNVIREGRIGENGVTCHDGQTSGGTCGEMKNTSTTWNYGGVVVEGLVEVEGPELVVEKGDSGGPFFFSETSREVLMQGLFVVISELNGAENKRRGAFMPLNTVLATLKLELLTKNNENRAKDKEEHEKEGEGSSKPEFKPTTKQKFTGASGASELVANNGAETVTCERDTSGGEVASPTLLGGVVIRFLGCKSSGSGGSGCTVKSTGAPAEGLIITATLHGLLGVVLPKPAAGSNVGLLLLPTSGKTFTTLASNTCTMETKVTGSVGGLVKPTRKSQISSKVIFGVSSGKQNIKDIDLSIGGLAKPELNAFSTAATEETEEALSYEKEVEVT